MLSPLGNQTPTARPYQQSLATSCWPMEPRLYSCVFHKYFIITAIDVWPGPVPRDNSPAWLSGSVSLQSWHEGHCYKSEVHSKKKKKKTVRNRAKELYFLKNTPRQEE